MLKTIKYKVRYILRGGVYMRLRPHRSTTTYVRRCGLFLQAESVYHSSEPRKNGWTHRVVDSGWPKEACVTLGCTLVLPREFDWTVHVRRRCGLFVKLLWPLVL